MITQTSETAVRALIYLALATPDHPVTPREIAEVLQESPSYMAKITRTLARGQILRSHHGAFGGVTLARHPRDITLLEIIELCQGLIIGNYCQVISDHPRPTCGFHQAMDEVNLAVRTALGGWSLADLATEPGPSACPGRQITCRINLGHLCPYKTATRTKPPHGRTPSRSQSKRKG